jgi:hypothetical protein
MEVDENLTLNDLRRLVFQEIEGFIHRQS